MSIHKVKKFFCPNCGFTGNAFFVEHAQCVRCCIQMLEEKPFKPIIPIETSFETSFETPCCTVCDEILNTKENGLIICSNGHANIINPQIQSSIPQIPSTQETKIDYILEINRLRDRNNVLIDDCDQYKKAMSHTSRQLDNIINDIEIKDERINTLQGILEHIVNGSLINRLLFAIYGNKTLRNLGNPTLCTNLKIKELENTLKQAKIRV